MDHEQAGDPPADPAPEAGSTPDDGAPGDREPEQLDLDAYERELHDVEAALARLDEGTYWVDEVTGEPLADELLAAQPTLRTAARTRPVGNPAPPHDLAEESGTTW